MNLLKFTEYGSKIFEKKRYSKNIYWKHQLDEVLDLSWSEIKTKKSGGWNITFYCENDSDEYGYTYTVYLKNFHGEEYYYLEETAIPIFIEKFKKEFKNNPQEYAKDLVFDPKCLGDVDMYRDAEKFNM